MTEREKVLARVREALTMKSPLPGHAVETLSAGKAPDRAPASKQPTAHDARKWLPPVADSFDAQLALFRENAAALKADFCMVGSRDELTKYLVQRRDAEAWNNVASHTGELTNATCKSLALPVCRTDAPYNVTELETCDAAITECDALVAQFGSVLVTSRSAGGRALSILPPHHVVLARREQLVRDLPTAFELLKQKYGGNYPSMISFITGPSRTGDIERILVLGAHGPKKLTILFVNEHS